MGLIRFHRLLIVSGIIFCAGFGAWQLRTGMRSGRNSEIAIGLVFAALAGLLVVYLLHLPRVLRLPRDGAPDARGPSDP